MSLGVAAYMLLFNRPFYGFLTFDMDKLVIIRRHHWKERLKISKAAKFESDLLKPVSNEDITPRRLYGEDAPPPPPTPPLPHDTNVCKSSKLCGALSLLA